MVTVVAPQKARASDFTRIRPLRRAIGGDVPSFLRPPDREDDGDEDRCDLATGSDAGPLDDDEGRVGIELEPPDEEGSRLIDWPASN